MKAIDGLKRKCLNLLPDKTFLKIKYRRKFGQKMDLTNPKKFSEKMQWLKLYDRNPLYTKMVDKYEVREYIKEKIGEEYLIPLIGVYDNFDDIDFEKLPNEFVIKCTHDSGGLAICKNKKEFDIEKAREKINKCLKKNYYYHSREWPYKNVKPRIIIEKYMGNDLLDYRFYTFNGDAKYIYLYVNETQEEGEKPEPLHCNIYDMNWELQEFRNKYLPSKEKLEKPINFNKMTEISNILSKNTYFLRVDFYEIDKKIYVGELTFFPRKWFCKIYTRKV